MMRLPALRFLFSSSADIARKTHLKFTERYAANLEEFQKKVTATSTEGEQIRLSTQKAYVHPFDNVHKRVFLGVANTLRVTGDLVGPEQVSPHYEHFSHARRHAIIFFAGLAILRFIAGT